VELSEGDIVIDLAHQRGATDGAVVELWRPLAVKHPVTGQLINDRFLIGRLKLVQVRDALSLARPDGKLARAALAGDIVILRLAKAAGPAGAKPVLVVPVAPTPSAPVPAAATSAAPVASEATPPAPCDDTGKSTCDVDAIEVSNCSTACVVKTRAPAFWPTKPS